MITYSSLIWKGKSKIAAVSHVWGHQGKMVDDDEPCRNVSGGKCAERFFSKRDLAAKALNVHPDLVWIDAVDVEQFDKIQKAEDVKLMQTVYKGVARTIVVMEGSPPKLTDLLSVIISSGWYKRSWVFQEIMLSTKLCFLHEDGIISFNDLMIDEINKCAKTHVDPKRFFEVISPLVKTRASRSPVENVIITLPLKDALSAAMEYEAYYEQDRLVAIGNAYDLCLPIDYTSRLSTTQYMNNCATKYDLGSHILPYAGVPCMTQNISTNRSCIPMTWEFCMKFISKDLDSENPPMVSQNGIMLTVKEINFTDCIIVNYFEFNADQLNEYIKDAYIEQLMMLPDIMPIVKDLKCVNNNGQNQARIVKYSSNHGLILFWNVSGTKLDIKSNWYIRSEGMHYGSVLGSQTVSFLIQISSIENKNIVTGYGVSLRNPWSSMHTKLCKILVN